MHLSDFPSIINFFHAVQSYPPGRIAVELLVIGVVVYYVIEFLRGTRGARMLRGIAVILILLNILVNVIGAQWHLQELVYLYNLFLPYAATAIIIVFQPELRRALLRLGETRLFRAWSSQLDEEIDELVKTAAFLSRNKIGGLIAIERQTRLGALSENGTRLNAELSADLLNTIFWPNSPLHDLGVVISNGRIMFAGVQFPLAESGELEKELGSRHRAAVGMSQDSDAVVLVVSEETGDISIAERGQLIRKLGIETLRELLVDLLGSSGSIGMDEHDAGDALDDEEPPSTAKNPAF